MKTRGIDACATLWVAAVDDDAKEAAKTAAAYLALMLWSLKGAVRPNHDAAFEAAQATFLDDAERNWILERQGKPLVTPATIVLRLRYAGARCSDKDARDRYESCIDDVATALGGCKRIYSTPIPPTYSRHASRAGRVVGLSTISDGTLARLGLDARAVDGPHRLSGPGHRGHQSWCRVHIFTKSPRARPCRLRRLHRQPSSWRRVDGVEVDA